MKVNTIIDGRYKIISLVGKGGTSAVYKAINIKLGTEWAIKVISKSGMTKQDETDLLVEPNLLKKLQHPSLPRIVDILETKENFFIIEDFIDGTSLQNLLAQVEKFSEEKVIKWAKELSSVLLYLHEQKPNPIIYRDMKPGNIMLNKDGSIKLIDFGIAREYKKDVSSDTTYLGTRGYAAPEQYGTHQTDERSDIYSLGVTLYHLITGKGPDQPPFEIKPVRTIDPKLSEGIEHIILKATKTDPTKRYANITELIYDLKNIDKLSGKYKKQKRAIQSKMAGIVATFIAFNSCTFVGAYSIRNDQIGKYLEQIELAKQTAQTMGVEESIEEFQQAINKFPKRDEGYLALASTYIKNLQYDKALKVLQKDAKTNNKDIKNNEEYSYLLGIALFSKENYKGAEAELAKIKGKDFDGIDQYYAIAELLSKPQAANAEEIVGELEKFKNYVDNLEDGEEKISGYVMLSNLYSQNAATIENGNEMSVQILEQATSQGQAKGNLIIYEKLAKSYFTMAMSLFNDEEKSIKYYNEALKSYNLLLNWGYETVDVYIKIALTQKRLNQLDQSEATFKRCIEKYPNDITAYAELGLLYKEIEDRKAQGSRNYSKVKEYYEKVKIMDGAETNMRVSALKNLIEDLAKQGY